MVNYYFFFEYFLLLLFILIEDFFIPLALLKVVELVLLAVASF